MGNRVLVQLVNSKDASDVSPVLYGHWSGDNGRQWLIDLIKHMGDRLGDVSYSFARLVQLAIDDDTGVTGFGVWNASEQLTATDSHGDAGIYILDVATKEIKHLE